MFDITELTVPKYHQALLSGATTVEEVATSYLNRISQYDTKLRSIIHVSSNCISQAQALDRLTNSYGANLPPLFGVPIVLKDTYLTTDLPTTNGSKALVGLESQDAFVVSLLRTAGALILGKTNVHEFCMQGCTFSSLGGQTLNPYDSSRTPGGSSGGTGAALAANLTLLGLGTDTMNSTRAPSSACCTVGLRPSTGQISKRGVFPVSPTQDAVGPMARTVGDVRILYHVLREGDPDDAAVKMPKGSVSPPLGSRKPRIGVLRSYFPVRGETEDAGIVLSVIEEALAKLHGTFDLVDIPDPDENFNISRLLSELDVQEFEFEAAFNSFLSSPLITKTPFPDLAAIAASGQFDERAMSDVFYNAQKPGIDQNHAEYAVRLQRMEELRGRLRNVFKEFELDAITFPHQRRLVMKVGTRIQLGRNGLLSSLSGFPSLCVPAGFSPPDEDAPLGVPVGLELVGKQWDDDLLLDIGEQVENILKARKSPELS